MSQRCWMLLATIVIVFSTMLAAGCSDTGGSAAGSRERPTLQDESLWRAAIYTGNYNSPSGTLQP